MTRRRSDYKGGEQKVHKIGGPGTPRTIAKNTQVSKINIQLKVNHQTARTTWAEFIGQK